jgi:flagellum-specific peptidoglycan hydrolase FlgJ/LysM repeat protein
MTSCKSKKGIVNHKSKPKTEAVTVKPKTPKTSEKNKTVFEYQTDYIEKYKEIAMREMREYGIPASITLAQGILESGAGKSVLSKQSNNHFGIKCHKDWKGKSVNYDDDAPQECFRKYKNPEESFIDHSKFLTGKKRYAFLFDLPKNNYIKWAFGLKKAGYATDPKYPKKLIKYIEKYNLYQYDNIVLGAKYKKRKKETPIVVVNEPIQKRSKETSMSEEKPKVIDVPSRIQESQKKPTTDTPKPKVSESVTAVFENLKEDTSVEEEANLKNKKPLYHTVIAGDTFYSLSKKYNVAVNTLKTLNNNKDNSLSLGQQILIKKPKVIINYKIHIVKKSDTLYSLSKKYNVSVNYLKEVNELTSNELALGQELKY